MKESLHLLKKRLILILESESINDSNKELIFDECWGMLKAVRNEGGSSKEAFLLVSNIRWDYDAILENDEYKYNLIMDIFTVIENYCAASLFIWEDTTPIE